MTDTQILIEQRDRLLDSIVDAHLAAELPGNSDTMAFARTIVRSALLGRLAPIVAPEAAAVVMPALPPMQIPISPDPPVEAVSPEEAATPVSGVPGSPLSGETPGKVLVVEPTPATPRKQRQSKPVAAPVAEESLNVSGSSGAIFEARVYVLNCIEKRQGVSSRIVENLTGWDKPTAGKFIRQLMDEAQQKGRVPSGKAQRVNAGIGALLEAVAAVGDDEEPEDEELEEIEQAVVAPKRTVQTISETPVWWGKTEHRQCKKCQAVLMPRRQQLKDGKSKWEAPANYRLRSYCPPCSPKVGKHIREAGVAS